MEREKILGLEEEGWASLMVAVERVPAELRSEAGVVPGWSVKDLLWHCGKWADWVREPLEQIAGGSYDPDRAYPWERMNEDWALESKSLSWDEVGRGVERMRDDARRALEALGVVGEDAAREFVSETVEHYEEHAAEIERFAASSTGPHRL